LWARHVIHAVGPTWAGGKKGKSLSSLSFSKHSQAPPEKTQRSSNRVCQWHQGEPEELVEAVKSSLILAERHEWESIAIPAISSGIFGYEHSQRVHPARPLHTCPYSSAAKVSPRISVPNSCSRRSWIGSMFVPSPAAGNVLVLSVNASTHLLATTGQPAEPPASSSLH